jgi:uncharacterized protein YndB with AHSA1/START domain
LPGIVVTFLSAAGRDGRPCREPLPRPRRNRPAATDPSRPYAPGIDATAPDATAPADDERIVSASRVVDAPAATIFELIADPAQQPRWDGNDNLAVAAASQRVRAVGDVFTMTLTGGQDRHNHVVAFDEGRTIAWRPSEPGSPPPGHLWRWDLEPVEDHRTLVVHTYDWTHLADPGRVERARSTTADRLLASIDRLAALVEPGPEPAA